MSSQSLRSIFALLMVAAFHLHGLGNPTPDNLAYRNYLIMQMLQKGQFSQALPHAEQMPELISRVIGNDSAEYVFALNNLGHVYLALEDFESAAATFSTGIPVTVNAVGRQHPAYLNLVVGLAASKRGKGDLPEAMALAREACNLYRQAPDLLRPVASAALSEGLVSSMLLGRFAEAEAFLRDLKQLPEFSNAVNPSLLVLEAGLRLRTGKVEAARELYLKATRKVIASHYPAGLDNVLNESALFFADIGENAKAASLFSRSWQALKESTGTASHAARRVQLNLAHALLAKGDVSSALSHFIECRKALDKESDPSNYARALAGIGTIQRLQGNLDEAIINLEEASRILSRSPSASDNSSRRVNINLAYARFESGLRAQAKELVRELVEEVEGDAALSALEVAETYNVQADLLFQSGDYSRAEARYQTVLGIAQSFPASEAYITAVVGLATVHSETGRLDEAKQLLSSIEELLEKFPDLDIELKARWELAKAHVLLKSGEVAKAQEEFDACLNIFASHLDSMADAYISSLRGKAACLTVFGDSHGAANLLKASLDALEGKYGWRNSHTLSSALQLSDLYHSRLGQDRAAEDLLDQVGDHLKAMGLMDSAMAAGYWHQRGSVSMQEDDPQRTLDYLQKAFQIYENLNAYGSYRQIPVLNSMAMLVIELNKPNKAVAILGAALERVTESYPFPYEWALWSNLSTAFERLGHRPEAILCAKAAVQKIQPLREQVAFFGGGPTLNFIRQYEDLYRDLIRLLLLEDRIFEAQEVIRLLKMEEAFQFNRGTAFNDDNTLLLQEEEKRALENIQRYAKSQEQVQREFLDELKRTPLREEMDDTVRRFAQGMLESAKTNDLQDFPASADQTENIRHILNREGDETALLQYIVHPDELWILFHTSKQTYTEAVPLESLRLTRLVYDFRKMLGSPFQSPEATAENLYEILLKPVEPLLIKYGTDNIFISTDHVLRYVPFAALRNNDEYLLGKYTFALFPVQPAEEIHTELPPSVIVEGVGLGSSTGFQNLPDLPYVEDELTSIFNDEKVEGRGPVAGAIHLNEAFDKSTLIASLGEDVSALHIATHFKFNPLHASQSILYLGGGDSVSLFDLSRSTEGVPWPRMLTLSACETGLSGSLREGKYGREIEGFTQLAYSRGVQFVLGSLWQVADDATSILMEDIYRILADQSSRTSVPHALKTAKQKLFQNNRFSHPFFWAGFTCTSPSFRPAY